MAGAERTGTDRQRQRAKPPARLADAVEAIGAGAYVVDEQGLVLAANTPAERLLGRPAADLLGQDAHDLLHRGPQGQPLPTTQCAMRQAFHAGSPAQGHEEHFLRGDGSLLPVSWMITPYDLGDTGDRRTGTLVVFHTPEHADSAEPRPERATESLTDFERLALLAETTTRLTSTLDVDEALRRLVSLVLPRLADWAVIDLITEHDEVWRTAVVHAEGDRLVHQEDLEGPMPPVPEESPMPLSRALRGVASALAGPATYRRAPDSGIAVEQRRLFEATGIHSAAIAPIRGTREVLGALTLGRAEKPGDFTTADLPLLEDIARRAGVALDNARLYQRQRAVAETMQNHLLPQMPRVPGLQMAVRYLPAPDASQVGGDWYDAFTLPDGSTALAIGDVVGHDLEAAAGMAQLRNMLRAYAWSQQEPPSRIVQRLDEAIMPITDVTMATLVLARLTRTDDDNWQLTWTNAGHPPPLLITRDGLADYLTEGHSLLLGTGVRAPRPDASVLLPPGCTLLLYTDGLIEAPGHTLDEGLSRLRQHAAALAHRPLPSLTDQLLRRVHPPGLDDVALLALRTPPQPDPGRTASRRR
ncbi:MULTISPECIES: SpoIIE family protein phosphatase [Streptomyces]|uniref:protein-serine/threonine phosphatase n=2 Tax=Streptomyces TaxID=1883 RepID=A0A101QBB1_STRCK|nr:SpoIIE family protein phosphatase [Streptomyces corchorusii]AEY90594.1 DNA-binding protein [Streptomyces hygroscopicus subsp. jinggangensis 5008]AGF64753.1 DNA-binding protein [Streptomyces hygroscopicus subsp. jinggangensis TL01]KUN26928.1 DNA-binding protein [Streptomyces corchorusii]